MSPDEAVMASIKLNPFDEARGCYQCGCSQRGRSWFLCQYHDGFADGVEAAAASSTADTETPK